MTKFPDRVKGLLRRRGITTVQFEADTGICRTLFYRRNYHAPRRSTIMALAYYFDMTAEDLVEGTDAEDIWRG